MRKIEVSNQEKNALIEKRNFLFEKLCHTLPEYYSDSFDVQKSERYWKLMLYRFLIPFCEYYCTCDYLSKQTDFDKFHEGDVKVPRLDRQFEEFSYQNIYNPEKPLTVESLQPMESSSLQRTGLKSRLKDFIFKAKLKVGRNKPKFLLFSEFMPEIWPQVYPELRMITPKFTNSEASIVKVDTEARESLRKCLLSTEFFEQSFVNFFVQFYPMDYVENLEHNTKRLAQIPKIENVDQIVFGWIPDITRRMYAGEILEKDADCSLSIIQHGGTYGEYDHSLWEKVEKDLSDQFFSWSQKSYNHSTTPTIPTRLLKFRENYNRKKLQGKVHLQYDMLIVDGMQNKTINFFNLQGLGAKEENLVDFIKGQSNGKGQGILLRVYDRRGIVDADYIPRIKSTFPELTIHTQEDSLINDMLMSDKLFVNYLYSTFKWEANQVGRAVVHLSDYLEDAK